METGFWGVPDVNGLIFVGLALTSLCAAFITGIAGAAGGLAGSFWGVGSNVAPLLGWRQFLFIFLVVMVGGAKNIGGVIIVGAVTGIALAAMTLQFGQVLYAQLALIVAFVVFMKLRGKRTVGAGKV